MSCRPTKSRAKFLDPGVKMVGEYIDEEHPEWGLRFAIYASDGRRLAKAQHANVAWIHACRKLESERGT